MKNLALLIAVLVILGGGYYFYSQKNNKAIAPATEQDLSAEESNKETPNAQEEQKKEEGTGVKVETGANAGVDTGTAPSQGNYSTGEEGMAPDVLVVQVNYDGSKFEPASVDIKTGDIVIFKNNGDAKFWPASANHPTHTLYPEFDAQTGIDAGGKFQFKFEKPGAWKYHDHLNPAAGGVVNVTNR